MLISSRGRYALRVMIDLAEHDDGTYTPMKEVACRQDISLKYLERILPILVAAKMIEGMRGKGGGYRLTRKPEAYRISDILRLTEGDLAPVACLECDAPDCTLHALPSRPIAATTPQKPSFAVHLLTVPLADTLTTLPSSAPVPAAKVAHHAPMPS